MTFAMGGAPVPGSDRIPVELFQILKDDAVESAALNMQYAICTQYTICRLPTGIDATEDTFLFVFLYIKYSLSFYSMISLAHLNFKI